MPAQASAEALLISDHDEQEIAEARCQNWQKEDCLVARSSMTQTHALMMRQHQRRWTADYSLLRHESLVLLCLSWLAANQRPMETARLLPTKLRPEFGRQTKIQAAPAAGLATSNLRWDLQIDW
jgi:hypothetical protein